MHAFNQIDKLDFAKEKSWWHDLVRKINHDHIFRTKIGDYLSTDLFCVISESQEVVWIPYVRISKTLSKFIINNTEHLESI